MAVERISWDRNANRNRAVGVSTGIFKDGLYDSLFQRRSCARSIATVLYKGKEVNGNGHFVALTRRNANKWTLTDDDRTCADTTQCEQMGAY